jgi:hypothetical protein
MVRVRDLNNHPRERVWVGPTSSCVGCRCAPVRRRSTRSSGNDLRRIAATSTIRGAVVQHVDRDALAENDGDAIFRSTTLPGTQVRERRAHRDPGRP